MNLRADPQVDAAYRAAGWWGDDTLAQVVGRHAATRPDGIAFVEGDDRMTWTGYDTLSDRIAAALIGAGLARDDCAVVFLPDSPVVHAAYVGAEKAGVVVMGVGHRAGQAELDHLVGKSGARAIVTEPTHRDGPVRDLVDRLRATHAGLAHHVVLDGPSSDCTITVDGEPAATDTSGIAERRMGASELCMLNSTSGTTGLPKCVTQFQNRWFYFHQKAVEFGELTGDDRFLVVVPAPFGFGLWTSHYTPTILGSPTTVMRQFRPEGLIELVEREQITVLCAVSTQFIMMLNSPAFDDHDLSSLRIMFTGGEAIPYQRAAEFEDRTGCTVLNFYGSNETGTLTGTTTHDPRDKRLTTGGRCIPEMECRLYEPGSENQLPLEGEGQPACKGPATTLGYYEDDAANAELFTSDGWMLMGDIVRIDDEGYLSVIGRTSDFIIRGGKNISAPAVEDEVASHPAVEMVACVAAPDPVFGERVAAYVELAPGAELSLDELKAHLAERGVSKEWYPEHLFVVEALPRSSGGKVAKGELRDDVRTRVGSAS